MSEPLHNVKNNIENILVFKNKENIINPSNITNINMYNKNDRLKE